MGGGTRVEALGWYAEDGTCATPQLQPHVDPQGDDLLLEPNGERTLGAAGPAADAAGISTPNTPPEGLLS